MRSASSSTKCCNVRSEKPFVFTKWSDTRPGVPTSTCGRRPRLMACAIMSTPPTSVEVRMLMAAPSASNWGAE